MMIRLTPQQHEELPKGPTDIARAIDPCSNVEYVLMRAEAYDRLVGVADSDAAAIVNELMAEDDANDPHLESYQQTSP